MYHKPAHMEPLLPSGATELEDLAREVVSRSAALGGQLHQVTQQAVVELLRLINSYYSNLIEGHSTHPIDIERAMRSEYSSDPSKRDHKMKVLPISTASASWKSVFKMSLGLTLPPTSSLSGSIAFSTSSCRLI
jgi:hypothetical protein